MTADRNVLPSQEENLTPDCSAPGAVLAKPQTPAVVFGTPGIGRSAEMPPSLACSNRRVSPEQLDPILFMCLKRSAFETEEKHKTKRCLELGIQLSAEHPVERNAHCGNTTNELHVRDSAREAPGL